MTPSNSRSRSSTTPGVTLSTSNSAAVHALVFEDDPAGVSRVTSRYLRGDDSVSIGTLADGASDSFNLTVDLTGVGVDWDQLHSVVLVDYRPGGFSGPWDMAAGRLPALTASAGVSHGVLSPMWPAGPRSRSISSRMVAVSSRALRHAQPRQSESGGRSAPSPAAAGSALIRRQNHPRSLETHRQDRQPGLEGHQKSAASETAATARRGSRSLRGRPAGERAAPQPRPGSAPNIATAVVRSSRSTGMKPALRIAQPEKRDREERLLCQEPQLEGGRQRRQQDRDVEPRLVVGHDHVTLVRRTMCSSPSTATGTPAITQTRPTPQVGHQRPRGAAKTVRRPPPRCPAPR